jgi:hypothetical protein
MRNKILFILLFLYIVPAYANGDIDLSSEIAKYFFKPIKMEKISGTLIGSYIALPEDNIPYERINIFGNEKYPMRYYSNSMCIKGKKCNGSIITLFDQEFSLGKIGDEYFDIQLDSTWWFLKSRGRTYICSLASISSSNLYSFVFLLFDITDKQKIKYYFLDTFAFDDLPLIGSLPGSDGQLYFLRTEVDGCFVTTPYSITDHGLVEYKKANGDPYNLKFHWNKWKYDEIEIEQVPEKEVNVVK